jgi:hypothetical protein
VLKSVRAAEKLVAEESKRLAKEYLFSGVCMRAYVCMCVYIYIHMFSCMRARVYVCVYIYVHMFSCMLMKSRESGC